MNGTHSGNYAGSGSGGTILCFPKGGRRIPGASEFSAGEDVCLPHRLCTGSTASSPDGQFVPTTATPTTPGKKPVRWRIEWRHIITGKVTSWYESAFLPGSFTFAKSLNRVVYCTRITG